MILVPCRKLAGRCSSTAPPFKRTKEPCWAPLTAVSIERIETEAILGKASPRNPRVRIRNKSSRLWILLVAWRLKAVKTSSSAIPSPLSMTWILRKPASSIKISIWVLPASTAFSTNSLTTEAGRSTTSPAAIWFARRSDNSWIFPIC